MDSRTSGRFVALSTIKAPVFLRDATGLVREFSMLDTLNISLAVTQPSIFSIALQIAFIATAYPGADWVWTMVLGLAVILPMTIVYILLSTCMPRSGGDYVWESRLLNPALGFMSGWAYWIALLSVVAFLSYTYTTVSIPDALVLLGYGLNAPFLLSWASALTTSTTTAFVAAFVVSIVCAGIGMLNRRWFSRIMLVLFALTTVSVLACIGVLATATHAQFVSAFNSYPGTPSGVTYDGIISMANSTGWSFVPLAWGATLASVPASVGTYVGQNYAAAIGGEIRGIKRNITIGMLAATFWCFLVNTYASALTANVVGYQFTYAAFALGAKWPLAAPPWVDLFVSMLTQNTAVLVIMQVGWLTGMIWAIAGLFLVATRYVFAFSFDRVLPTQLADVSDRFKVPIKAAVVNLVVALIFLVITVYTSIFSTNLNAIVIYSFVWVLASIAAVVLPYRKKVLAAMLPGAKWRIPLITIVGAISAVLMIANLYWSATTPAIGPSSPRAGAVMAGIFLVGLFIYFGSRMYRKRQGINLDLAYAEIPPE
jgi:amino acid transporter